MISLKGINMMNMKKTLAVSVVFSIAMSAHAFRPIETKKEEPAAAPVEQVEKADEPKPAASEPVKAIQSTELPVKNTQPVRPEPAQVKTESKKLDDERKKIELEKARLAEERARIEREKAEQIKLEKQLNAQKKREEEQRKKLALEAKKEKERAQKAAEVAKSNELKKLASVALNNAQKNVRNQDAWLSIRNDFDKLLKLDPESRYKATTVARSEEHTSELQSH